MSNAFEILGLSPSLSLDLSEAENRWKELSREAHPDTDGGDAEKAALINDSWKKIQSSVSRLRLWLELQSVEIPRSTQITETMMALFGEIGATLNELDTLIAEKKRANSALAKALLTEREIGAQQKLQGMILRLSEEKSQIEDRFGEIEESEDFAAGLEALGRLGFLEKWESQCRERFVALATA